MEVLVNVEYAKGGRVSFVLTNVVANRLLIPLLRSGVGRRLGRRLTVIEYLGRRSGRHHQLVARYFLSENAIRIRVGMPERKTWWRNFLTGHPVRLRLAGHDYDTTAHVVRGNDAVFVVAKLDNRAP